MDQDLWRSQLRDHVAAEEGKEIRELLVRVEGALAEFLEDGPPLNRESLEEILGAVRSEIQNIPELPAKPLSFGPWGTQIEPSPGLLVRVKALGDTKGMLIKPKHLDCRKQGEIGTLRSHVPGHGGDVWSVGHASPDALSAYSVFESNPVGAYCLPELEPVTFVGYRFWCVCGNKWKAPEGKAGSRPLSTVCSQCGCQVRAELDVEPIYPEPPQYVGGLDLADPGGSFEASREPADEDEVDEWLSRLPDKVRRPQERPNWKPE